MRLALRLNAYRPIDRPWQKSALEGLQTQLPTVVRAEFTQRWQHSGAILLDWRIRLERSLVER